MALTFNGTANTIAGLAVGGLPDGTVDNDSLANTTIAAGKLASGVGGKILQVVSTTSTAADSVSCASTAWEDLGPTRAITPSSTNSKIWITGAFSVGSDSTNMNIDARLEGGGSVLTDAIGVAAGNRKRGTCSMQHTHSEDQAILTINYLHSPGTDSSITYKLQFGTNSGHTRTIYINRTHGDTNNAQIGRFTSTLTCMEIGA